MAQFCHPEFGCDCNEDKLRAALRSMRELASVSVEGDGWYAENAGLDTSAIFAQAREALGE